MKRISVYIFFVLFTACKSDRVLSYVSFTVDDFEQVNLSVTESEGVECKDLFLGRPMSLVYHPDDFLLIRDSGTDRQLTVVDLLQMTSSSEINRGRSANELLYLWDISVSDHDIFVSSLNDNKLLRMEYDNDCRKFEYAETIVFPESFYRCAPFDGDYLTFPSASSKHRFHLWNRNVEIKDTIGTFPSDGIDSDVLPDNGLFQSVLAVSPNGKCLATAYIGIDYIDVYDDLGLCARIRGPECFDVSSKTKIVSDGHAFSFLRPDITAYTCIVGTESCFYVGYVGLKMSRNTIPDSDGFKIKTIFSFSWSGMPMKAYILDKPVDSFCVDEKSGTLYFLMSNPEYEIRLLRHCL